MLENGTGGERETPRMMIVDDMPSIRKRIREILENGGYEVVGEAEDGDEAVRMALELNPDVIVMDYVMKKMDGIRATHLICGLQQTAKIVLVTQSPSPSVVVDSIRAGAINFVIKPFQEGQLLNVVRHALNS